MSNPAYRVLCGDCGAEPGETCIWTGNERRIMGEVGSERTPHRCRSIDGREAKSKFMQRVLNTGCPQCGAKAGARCMRISRAKNANEWVYCAPYGQKKGFCLGRYWRTQGRGFLDPDESATESGMLVPPEWHESATTSGLLAELPDDDQGGERMHTGPIKSRPVGQQHAVQDA